MLSHFFFRFFHFVLQLPGGDPEDTAADGGQLNQGVRGGYPQIEVGADLRDQRFDISVTGLTFGGVDYLDIVESEFLAGVALALVAVKDQNNPALLEAG